MAIRRIQFRRGTKTEWDAANPVLAIGEPGFERDTNVLKVGNGADVWAVLKAVGADRVAKDGDTMTGQLILNAGLNIAGGNLYVRGADASYGANVAIRSGSTGDKILVLRNVAGQTANPFEIQNSAGTALAAADFSGQLYGRFQQEDGAARTFRRVKSGLAGSGPGGVGCALFIDA